MIKIDDYFAKMIALGFVPSELVMANAQSFIPKVNNLLAHLGVTSTRLNSGWRSVEYNLELRRKWLAGIPGGANASTNSLHCSGRAVDISDVDRRLVNALTNDIGILTQFGLYMEHQSATPTWCHLQDVAPKSGSRIFKPF